MPSPCWVAIWLDELPCIPLMYRPNAFYTINESHWTGFPVNGDGSGVPPTFDVGAGVKMFYMIKPVAQ